MPVMGIQQPVPEIPLQEFNNIPEVFKDPKDIVLGIGEKEVVLGRLKEAYLQAWMSQKVIEITYQRFLHGFYNKDGLVAEALKNELASTQNQIKIAEGVLTTLQEWEKYEEDTKDTN